MLLVLISVILFLLVVISIVYWRCSQRPEQRLKAFNTKLVKMSKQKFCRPNEIARLLKDIYTVLNICMAKGDQAGAYKAVDLLKIAFTEGFWRMDEPLRLTGIVVAALKAQQPDITSIVLDAFRPMMRKAGIDLVPQMCEQFSLISVIALKEKQHFLVAKAAEHVFYILEKPEWFREPVLLDAALKALKVVGVAALKHHDDAFLREIGARIIACGAIFDDNAAASLTNIFGSWMHQVVKYNDKPAFEELSSIVGQLFVTKILKGTNLITLLNEWEDLAGCAALNPDMSLAASISGQMLGLGAQTKNIKIWTKAVKSVVEVTKLALSRGSLEDSFPIIHALMESGRKLMLGLKHGHSFDDFSPQAIYIVVKECVMLTEYIARSDMTSTAGEVTVELFQRWTAYPAAQCQSKSVRKFCQIMLIYWQNSKKRLAKKTLSEVRVLAEPMLITETDRQILGL